MTTDADLIQRCAAFGWQLRRNGDEWLLVGNGSPARFRTTDSLEAWLGKQEHAPAPRETAAAQLEMELSA